MSKSEKTGRRYTIKDKYNRIWGCFYVVKEEFGHIYGYLKPTDCFDEVKQLFIEHEKAFLSPDGDTNITAHKIIQLGAYLVDNSSGEYVDISSTIFVSKELLVSCAISPRRAE